MDYQEQLDRGTRQTNRMVDESIAAARERCAAGDFETGARAWALAAAYCNAMSIGRGIVVPADGGGLIQPMAGDK